MLDMKVEFSILPLIDCLQVTLSVKFSKMSKQKGPLEGEYRVPMEKAKTITLEELQILLDRYEKYKIIFNIVEEFKEILFGEDSTKLNTLTNTCLIFILNLNKLYIRIPTPTSLALILLFYIQDKYSSLHDRLVF